MHWICRRHDDRVSYYRRPVEAFERGNSNLLCQVSSELAHVSRDASQVEEPYCGNRV